MHRHRGGGARADDGRGRRGRPHRALDPGHRAGRPRQRHRRVRRDEQQLQPDVPDLARGRERASKASGTSIADRPAVEPPERPGREAEMPIRILAESWDQLRKAWEGTDEERPPVLILVCKNTRLASVIYAWLSDRFDLVLEAKGGRDEKADIKVQAAERWVAAVNA